MMGFSSGFPTKHGSDFHNPVVMIILAGVFGSSMFIQSNNLLQVEGFRPRYLRNLTTGNPTTPKVFPIEILGIFPMPRAVEFRLFSYGRSGLQN